MLLLHSPGGANDVPAMSGAEVNLQLAGRTYRGALTEQGEATFTNLPAAAKNQSAEVSFSAPGWQLAKDASQIQLSGKRAAIALERRGIVVRGAVTAANSAAPLPGASVVIGGVTTATDQSGRFSVSVPAWRPDSPLSLAVTLPGYLPFSERIKDQTVEQVVSLAPVPAPSPAPRRTNEVVQASAAVVVTNAVRLADGAPAVDPVPAVQATNSAASYLRNPPLEQRLADAYLLATNRNGKDLRKADEKSKQALADYRSLANEDFSTFGTAFAVALLRRAEILSLIPNDRDAGECYREAKAVYLKLGADTPWGVQLAVEFNNHAVWLSNLKDPPQNPRIADAYQQAITSCSNAVHLVPTKAFPMLALSYLNLGRHLGNKGDNAGAVASYEGAVRACLAPAASQDAEVISCRVQAQRELASTLDELGRKEQARTNYQAAIAACEGLRSRNQWQYLEELARVQGDFANFLKPLDRAAALQAYERAISLYGSLAGDANWTNRQGFASCLNAYAVLLDVPGATNRAAEVDLTYQRALEQSRAVRNHPQELRILCNHGVFLAKQDRLPEARAKYLKALEVGRAYLDKQPAEVGAPLVEAHLGLARLEYNQSFETDRAARTPHLEAATKEVKEALKLIKTIKKLPGAGNMAGLERDAQKLNADIGELRK